MYQPNVHTKIVICYYLKTIKTHPIKGVGRSVGTSFSLITVPMRCIFSIFKKIDSTLSLSNFPVTSWRITDTDHRSEYVYRAGELGKDRGGGGSKKWSDSTQYPAAPRPLQQSRRGEKATPPGPSPPRQYFGLFKPAGPVCSDEHNKGVSTGAGCAFKWSLGGGAGPPITPC